MDGRFNEYIMKVCALLDYITDHYFNSSKLISVPP
jgi:hypothetical protein